MLPTDIERLFQFAAVSGVQALDGPARLRELLFQAQVVELRRRLPSIAADQDAAGREQACGREPDGTASGVHEFQASIDVVILLPEAAALPGNLVSTCICALCDHFVERRTEVVWRLFQHGEGHATDAVVGLKGLGNACMRVADADAVGCFANLRDRRPELDRIAQRLRKGVRNPVHAAHGLEHGGLHIKHFFKQNPVPEVLIEQRVHVDGLAQQSGLISRARSLYVTGALAAAVFAGVVQGSVHGEEIQHAVAIFPGHLLVEGAPADTLGQQLAHVAAGVVDRLALNYRFCVVGRVILQVARPAAVHFDFQCDSQFAAISKHVGVHRRQPGGTNVLIMAWIEQAGLCGAVGEDHFVAAAHAPVPAPGAIARLQQRAVVAKRLHLVGCHQAGDAATKNDHFDTFAGAGRGGYGDRLLRSRWGQSHPLHGEECCAVSSSLPNPHQKFTPGNRHRAPPPSAKQFQLNCQRLRSKVSHTNEEMRVSF